MEDTRPILADIIIIALSHHLPLHKPHIFHMDNNNNNKNDKLLILCSFMMSSIISFILFVLCVISVQNLFLVLHRYNIFRYCIHLITRQYITFG